MKQLSKTFAKLHGVSSILNLASFAALLLHGSVSGRLWSCALFLLLLLVSESAATRHPR